MSATRKAIRVVVVVALLAVCASRVSAEEDNGFPTGPSDNHQDPHDIRSFFFEHDNVRSHVAFLAWHHLQLISGNVVMPILLGSEYYWHGAVVPYKAAKVLKVQSKWMKQGQWKWPFKWKAGKAAKERKYAPRYEPPKEVDGWRLAMGGDVYYRDTEYDTLPLIGPSFLNVQEPESNSVGANLGIGLRRDWGGIFAVASLEREEFEAETNILDNTRFGVTLMPVYKLFQEDVHGFELNVGANLGYHHTSYDEEDQLDEPVGRPFGLGDFDNPDIVNAGVGAGIRGPVPLGRAGLALSQQWAWDLHRDRVVGGKDATTFTTAMVRYTVPLTENIFTGANVQMIHADDLKAGRDETTYSATFRGGWANERWSIDGWVTRDFSDQNVDEWIMGVGFGLDW